MGEIDPALRAQVWLRDEGVCQICMTPVDGTFHADHIWPKSAGGPDSLNNLRVAHAQCNLAKGTNLPRSAEILHTDQTAQRLKAELDRYRVISQHVEELAPRFEALWNSGVTLPNGSREIPALTPDWKDRLRRQVEQGLSTQEILALAQEALNRRDIVGDMGHWKWCQWLWKQRREAIAQAVQSAVQPLNRAAEMANLEALTQAPIAVEPSTPSETAQWWLSVELFGRPADHVWRDAMLGISGIVPMNLVDGPSQWSEEWETDKNAPSATGSEPLVLSGQGGPGEARQIIAFLTSLGFAFTLTLHPPRGVTPIAYLFEPTLGPTIQVSDGASVMTFASEIDRAISQTATRDELVEALQNLTAWDWRMTLTPAPWHGGPNEIATLDPDSPEGTDFYGR